MQPQITNENRLKYILIAMSVLLLVWFGVREITMLTAPVAPGNNHIVEIEIPPSSSTARVAQILSENDLIRSQTMFRLSCRLFGYDNRLQAGYYQFKPSMNMMQIVEEIVKGQVVALSMTIPEGYTLQEIGNVLIQKGICSKTEWNQALLKDYDFAFLNGIPMRENRLEGFLFPDTYRFQKGVDANQVIMLMLRRFDEVWQRQFAAEAEAKGMTPYGVLTIAAMVEKEALFDAERPRISGVMYNRIGKGMLLQVDATVIYALGRHTERVTYADLKIDSPYNTYRYAGMPPGPIASPGAASIEAALHPEQHNFLYYVAMKDGHHTFTRTYNEHLQAKRKNRE